MEAAWEAALQAHTASDAAQDDLWAWVIRAFDPRAPAEATERQQRMCSVTNRSAILLSVAAWMGRRVGDLVLAYVQEC